MVKKLLPDALWAETAPLFPSVAARPKGGRPWVEDRDALTGILFVLYTAIAWERLPFEVARCSRITCWRRLRVWRDAGLWDRIHRQMLERLNLAGEIDWPRASVASSSVAAKRGATRSARTRPTGANRVPSATSWSTARACLSPSS
ncbi:transposase [Pseudochelatococcus lubricantis]|uniref:transposase n=1 Tax=Pseudochelatococcus lubricantis TaxID=1538102 RepID=UPI0014237316